MRVVVSGWPLSWVGVGGIGGDEMRRNMARRPPYRAVNRGRPRGAGGDRSPHSMGWAGLRRCDLSGEGGSRRWFRTLFTFHLPLFTSETVHSWFNRQKSRLFFSEALSALVELIEPTARL
jgi:hypothetical protein